MMKESQSIRSLARLVAEMRKAQRDQGRYQEGTHEYLRRARILLDLEARVDAATAEVLGRGEE